MNALHVAGGIVIAAAVIFGARGLVRLAIRVGHRLRWSNHVDGCGRCQMVVKVQGPPDWLCDDGRDLGMKAWTS